MEQPSPIGKKLRMIHNKFREVADRNLQKYNPGIPATADIPAALIAAEAPENPPPATNTS